MLLASGSAHPCSPVWHRSPWRDTGRFFVGDRVVARRGRFTYATTMARSEKEKMLAGELYQAVGPELAADSLRADRLLRAYNATGAEEAERRSAILADLLGSVGEGVVLRPPFYCDYGYNIRLGRGVFANFGCVFV